MKVLIAGDFCQTGRVDGCVRSGEYGKLFDTVKPYTGKADYSIVNLEIPIVPRGEKAKPIAKYGPSLKGSEEAVKALAYGGFDCCTLANNHVMDQGEKCCIATKETVERNGLDAVGAGRNISEASSVLYKKINGETLAIINCCEHEFSTADEVRAGANPINPIQIYYQIQEAKSRGEHVIVITHGGAEMYQLPTPGMQERYRFFIDAGARAVVNHHQHCISGYERYGDGVIFYGLGNFCFDTSGDKDDLQTDGYMVELDLSESVGFEIYPYRQCADTAGVRMLSAADDDHKRILGKVEELNRMINDPATLVEKFNELVDRQEMFYNNMFSPFGERFFWRLKRIGMLGVVLRMFNWAKAMDIVACETHYERFVRMIERKIK